jgi:TPR repeat protein
MFSGSSRGVVGDDLQDGINAWYVRDFDTAHKLFAPLAEEGNAKSQYYMGLMYDNEQGVPRDYKEAVKWYRLAAEQGFSDAQYLLGVMNGNGNGVPQDYKKAIKWLLKSAEQKNIKAQMLIRTNYHQWHKQIAEQGDSYAQRFLGASYYLGLGVTQDYAEAAKWYKKAAEQEDRVAQNILGAMYEKGKGVPQDFVEAYKWLSLSEETVNGRIYKEKIEKRKMTSVQIVEAQKLIREWTEDYQKK